MTHEHLAAAAMLPDACDSHLHILDPAWPAQIAIAPHAMAADYRCVSQSLGTERAVIVQPRHYGIDNSATLAGIAALGLERTRGIAVLQPGVSDAELERLHRGGIRGARFSLFTPQGGTITFEMVEPLAQRVKALGWHLQLHWTAEQIVEHEALLRRLPTEFVFDHLARLKPPDALAHPAFALVCRLLEERRAWLKLSGLYLCSVAGAGSGYGDLQPLVAALIERAPDRLVWGSDWPHLNLTARPDPQSLLAPLSSWTGGDAAMLERILVTNPARLYAFGAAGSPSRAALTPSSACAPRPPS